MGFVTEQHEEWKSKIDADSAAFDPNYVIASESGEAGEAAPAKSKSKSKSKSDSGGAPEGYESQSKPQ